MGRLSEALEESGADRPKKLVIPRLLHEQLRQVGAQAAGPCCFPENRSAAGFLVGFDHLGGQHKTSRTRPCPAKQSLAKQKNLGKARSCRVFIGGNASKNHVTNAHSPGGEFAFAALGIKLAKTPGDRWADGVDPLRREPAVMAG